MVPVAVDRVELSVAKQFVPSALGPRRQTNIRGHNRTVFGLHPAQSRAPFSRVRGGQTSDGLPGRRLAVGGWRIEPAPLFHPFLVILIAVAAGPISYFIARPAKRPEQQAVFNAVQTRFRLRLAQHKLAQDLPRVFRWRLQHTILARSKDAGVGTLKEGKDEKAALKRPSESCRS